MDDSSSPEEERSKASRKSSKSPSRAPSKKSFDGAKTPLSDHIQQIGESPAGLAMAEIPAAIEAEC
eukprot:6013756-Karenia_brevis.AAC.1